MGAGIVERIGETHVESRFAPFDGLPLWPTGSFLVLGERHVVPIPIHRQSVITGYLRVWGGLPALAAFGLAGSAHGASRIAIQIACVALGAGYCATHVIGRLSHEEQARRNVYAKVTGHLADPALLTADNPALFEHLELDLQTRAEAISPDGYRGRRADWRACCESAKADASFLALALTATRIEAARGDANARTLHARIWSALAPMVSELPDRIEPVTEIARQDEESAPLPEVRRANAVTIEEEPSRPGQALEAGWDVTVRSAADVVNGRCASCLAATRATMSSGNFRSGNVEIPVCGSCQAHAARSAKGRSFFQALATMVAFSSAAVGLAPWLDFGSAAVIAGALAALTIALIPYLAPPRRAGRPATIALTAARVVGGSRGSITLHCTNEDWARIVAKRAGSVVRARRRLFAGAMNGIVAVPCAVQALVFLAYWFAHPSIKVDNGTGETIRVWVDGDDRGTIAPTSAKETSLSTVTVGWGRHTFEWGPVRKPGARSSVAVVAEIDLSHTYLWDPGRRHCYDMVVTEYGDAHADDARSGPLARSELYALKTVSDWFVESPKKIRTDLGGEVRYSLHRDPACPSLARCGAVAVDKYWDCMLSQGDTGNCAEVATELCDK